MRSWRVQLLVLGTASLAIADSSVPVRREPPSAAAPRFSTSYIVPKERGSEFYLSREAVQFWTPRIADVNRLEDRLPEFLKTVRGGALTRRVSDWGRQYVGVVGLRQRRTIWVNLFCVDEWSKDASKWPIVVRDGGDCYCRVDYDVTSGAFSNLGCNGRG